jgi:hypothetical protein
MSGSPRYAGLQPSPLAPERELVNSRRSVPLLLVIWLVIGAVVAGSHHYFDNLGSIGAILSAIIAVVLWPLILLGVKLTIAT